MSNEHEKSQREPGRIDEVGRSGVYPMSGPHPEGDAEVRTPDEFVHGQRDEHGRPVEGGSGPIEVEGNIVGGATPRPAGTSGEEGEGPSKG